MMGVYIKGMEMPKNCGRCFLRVGQCSKRIYMENRPLDCPIIEVPKSHNLEAHEPHGRLIDADALHKLFEDQWHYLQVLDWNENPTAEAMQSGINWCINTMHDDAPTVIPASEEE